MMALAFLMQIMHYGSYDIGIGLGTDNQFDMIDVSLSF